MDECGECGFTYDLAGPEGYGSAIREGVSEFATLLRRADLELAVRPAPGVWSLLEYGCHLRDVLIAQRERALLARRADLPFAEPMGRDERVEHDGYAGQDPTDVARQVTDAALLFANVLARLDPADWDRALVYAYPERRERPLRWLAAHTSHEVRHHLMDVRRQVGVDAEARTETDAEAGRSM